jgi:hypothetical protein
MSRLLVGFISVLLTAISLAGTAQAQERATLGWGRLFNNDLIGDGKDRWRTGSYTLSRIRGIEWTGSLPPTFGEILELRLSGEIIAPSNLTDPPPDDRRYVGALTAGLHTHFALGAAEAAAGINLVVTGPQTGLGRFQRNIHDWFGLENPEILTDQIEDGIYPTALVEIGRSYRIGPSTVVRPFAEAQAGVESYIRIGGDMSVGGQWTDALLVRDSSTGQRYVAVRGSIAPGISLSLGGDIAQVFDSAYLPSGGAAVPRDSRARLRAGLHWQGEQADVFYGLTWLGKEFDSQDGEQVVGSLRINLQF